MLTEGVLDQLGAVHTIEQIRGGGNNALYKVVLATGEVVAVKHYVSTSANNLLRLKKEFDGLSLLYAQGERAIPEPLYRDMEHAIAVYRFIDGVPLTDNHTHYVQEQLTFIARLKTYSDVLHKEDLWFATDAVLSLQDVLLQLERRCTRLLPALTNPDLHAFFYEDFLPVKNQCVERALQVCAKKNISPEQFLPVSQRFLSPSDFGWHNALVTAQGNLCFLDFEYFGWDDPAALLCDTLWHPATLLDSANKQVFLSGFLPIFAEDPTFTWRFSTYFPLVGLSWVCILLNDFLPEHWNRRVLSGKVTESQRTQKCQQQLQKARHFLERITDRDIA